MVTYVLRIKGFTPDTLPLSRLGEYLSALSELVGPEAPAHFDRVTKGSAKLKVKILEDAAPSIEVRVRFASVAEPNSEPRRAYERIQSLLRDDQTSAEFRPEKGAVILAFPGAKNAPPKRTASVRECGELNGRIIRLGGKDDTIPVGLLQSDGTVINCTATVELARQLKQYLLEPVDVVLSGVGRWTRTAEGPWEVSDFKISACDTLQYDGFDEALEKVRMHGSGWDAERDIDAVLHHVRYGD